MKSQPLDSELIYGIHPVMEAFRAGRRKIFSVTVAQARGLDRIRGIMDAARKANVPVQQLPSKDLDERVSGAGHQGVLAAVSRYPALKAMDLVDALRPEDQPWFLLIIENLEDPNNLGALIRTALCAGVHAVLVPKDRAAGLTPAVSKASAGAMEHAAVGLITNTAALIRRLKASGVWVAGLDADGGTGLFSADLTGNLALVVGGEHRGIRPLVKQVCDFLISLPLEGRVTSLNASVAGGIAMYEALRQRQAAAAGS